jgi:choice-of-anchor A domain-containing protein
LPFIRFRTLHGFGFADFIHLRCKLRSLYNGIFFGDFNASTGDIQGRLAVKGHFSVGRGYSVGDRVCSGFDSAFGFIRADDVAQFNLIVGHTAYWGSGELYPNGQRFVTPPPNNPCNSPEECYFVGEGTPMFDSNFGVCSSPFSACPNHPSSQCGSCATWSNVTSGCLDDNFDGLHTFYDSFSTSLAAQTPNTQVTVQYQGIHITCSASAARYYVTVTPAQLNAATWWTVSGCRFAAEWVINIDTLGQPIAFTGGDLGTIVERTIFNIRGSGRITIANTQVPGNILAPNAPITQIGSVIEGNVVADSFYAPGASQINKPFCDAFWPVKIEVRIAETFPTRRQVQNGDVNAYKCHRVLMTGSHGQFVPGDVVDIGTGAIQESATIEALITVNTATGLRFTAELANNHFAGVSIKASIANPLNQTRVQPSPTALTLAPCPTASTTGPESTSGATALVSSLGAVVAAGIAAFFLK